MSHDHVDVGALQLEDEKMATESASVLVPRLTSLCFPSIQNLSLAPIDLTAPLPVTRLGHCSKDDNASVEDEEDIPFLQRQRECYVSACLKYRRLRSRKQIFYKLGLKNHWSDQRKLISAVQNSEAANVQEMLEQGADPNVTDQKKRTPLHVAASQGQDRLVGLLLSKRADPNRQDILGNTPLHLAVCRGDLATVKVLIENGSNIFLSDNSGRTPLSLVKNRLGGLRRSKARSTDAFKSEFILMSELLSFSAKLKTDSDPFLTSMDDLCTQMQSVSTRERADEITDAALQQISSSVSSISLSNVALL